MKINVIVNSVQSISTENNGANVQGDEMVARAWVKYLARHPAVERAELNGLSPADVCVSFTPLAKGTSGLQVLYLQNAFPEPEWPGGTPGVFAQVREHFDHFIFTSPGLRNRCCDGLVLQFAVDPEVYYPRPCGSLRWPLVFVGNNIRDRDTTERYVLSCRDQGLVIFGNRASWGDEPACRGKCSVDAEAEAYSSAAICLNAHLADHLTYGSFNFRIFCALACGGFMVSDWSPQLEAEFGGCLVFTDGGEDLRRVVRHFLEHQHETKPFRLAGRRLVLERHTFAHRMNELVDWLGTKL
jgi:spore maturation protein CgeB